MENNIKRLRIFAGPNGSGKTTLINLIKRMIIENKTRMRLGIILNADLIEESLSRKPFLDLNDYNIACTDNEFRTYVKSSKLFKKTKKVISTIPSVKNNILFKKNISIDSYMAAIITDFLRKKIIESGHTFSYETVMSHPSRVHFIRDAKDKGYKTYLYFVGTEFPEINISRVKTRIQKGGHGVSEIKIYQRYYRSINLLKHAINIVDKSYIFDNSSELVLLATTENGKISLAGTPIPEWFKKMC